VRAKLGSTTVPRAARSAIVARADSAFTSNRPGRPASPGPRSADASEFQWLIWSAPASTNCRASMPVGTWPVTVSPSRCASAAIAGTSAGGTLWYTLICRKPAPA
jgi:hypothetical protein